MAATPTLMRLLAASVSVATKSGNIIRSVLSSGNLGIIEKGKNDLQTEADRAVQRCIVSSLQKQFPNITIVGEEEGLEEHLSTEDIEMSQAEEVLQYSCPQVYQSVEDSDLVVWVDPLDGTGEFTEGYLDHVTVLIGVAWRGRSIAGVVHQPYYNYKHSGSQLGRTMWGVVGLGAFGCEDRVPPMDGNVITTTRSHANKLVDDSVEACNPTNVIRVGGAGHKVLLLLDGCAHAYVFASSGSKKWDTCAPEALLRAKGGRLTDIHGNDLLYSKDVERTNSGGVLATLNSDHDWYISKIPESVKQALNPTNHFTGCVTP